MPRSIPLALIALFALGACSTAGRSPAATPAEERSGAPIEEPAEEPPLVDDTGFERVERRPPSAEPAAEGDDDMISATRRSMRTGVDWLARYVDSWFGDKPFDEGGSVTNGRLSINVQWQEDQGFEPRLRFGARFRLPNVERYAYAFIGRDNDQETVADVPAALSRQEQLQPEAREDQAFFVGLGTSLLDLFDFRIGFNVNQLLYAQLRYRRDWLLGERDRLAFRQTFYANRDTYLGSTTALSYEHDFSPTLLLRWVGGTTISKVTEQFVWSSNVALFKQFRRWQVLTLETLIEGSQDDGITRYGLQCRWQQPVYKDWLIGEIGVGHFWQYETATTDRERRWAAAANIKLLF